MHTVRDAYRNWFTKYHHYTSHQKFLLDLSAANQNHSCLFTVGQSFEKRNIQGIHIWGALGPGKKAAVIFHGTAHGREWISTMVTEYLAYQLLASYGKDKEITTSLDNFDFYILPIVNPDGNPPSPPEP